jgi:uncharacterized membrane protein
MVSVRDVEPKPDAKNYRAPNISRSGLVDVLNVWGVGGAIYNFGTPGPVRLYQLQCLEIERCFSNRRNLLQLVGLAGSVVARRRRCRPAGPQGIRGGVDAMVWANGTVLDLGRLPGTSVSFADDINAAGTIVGFSDNHAVEWAHGQILDFGGYLGVRPGSINATGHFVGFGIIAHGDVGGSIIDAGRQGSPLRYLSQSAFGEASTINDRDVVVGYDLASFSSPRIPWEWQFGAFTYLPYLAGTTSCTPNGINRNGTMVGTCGAAAVLWRRTGAVDLNSLIPPNSGWQLVVATTINRHGEIVGDGNFGGQFQAFVLEPDPRTAAY